MSNIFNEPKPHFTPQISFCDKKHWQSLLKYAAVDSKACLSYNKLMTWTEQSITKMRTK